MVKYNSLKLKKISIALVFVTFFKYIFCEEKKISQLKFPVTLTLYNNNILLITNEEIILYDSNLENKLNNYTLEESIRPTKVDESIKSMAYQYKEIYGFYILAFVHDHLFIFDKDGNKLAKIDMTSTFGNSSIYEIEPIKKKNNDLFYVISMTNSSPCRLIIYYYKINIVTSENTLVKKIEYHIVSGSGYEVFGISFNLIAFWFLLLLVIGFMKYIFLLFCLLRVEGRFSIPKLDELLVIFRKVLALKLEHTNFFGNFSKSNAFIDIFLDIVNFGSKFIFFFFIFEIIKLNFQIKSN